MREILRTSRAVGLLITVVLIAAACSGADADDDAVACVVRLHGRSQTGQPTQTIDDVTVIAPTGNGSFGLARQWLYGEQADFDEARFVVATEIAAAGCTDVVVNGFSNGGAFAARLYCDGESFGGTLRGVVIDDPVADGITNGCNPPPDVEIAFYWTGVLEDRLPPGTDCRDVEFECAGNLIIGTEAMASNLGTELLDSPFEQHRWHVDAPEIRGFLTPRVVPQS